MRVVLRVARVLTRIALRAHTGSTTERVDLEAAVVGERRQARELRDRLRLEARVVFERGSRFFDVEVGRSNLAEADELDARLVEQARELVARWVDHYNTVRLHSAIGYITPADFLAGRAQAIWAARDAKLEAARAARAARRAALRDAPSVAA